MRTTVAGIVAHLGGECLGDASLVIDRIATLEAAQASHIGFVANPRYRAQLANTQAGCVIVAPALAAEAAARTTVIVTADPYLYYARLSQWWAASDSSA
jgi:UDP-3-O-[3-hydroxymyristoyl] glucosamine N-acyltransferase